MTVYNERVKLFATALNVASVASVAVGVIAPLAAIGGSRDPFWTIVEVSIWLFLAVALHLSAQLVV